MCELLVACAAEPFPLGRLWPLAEAMERLGLAGWGWGVAWLGADGALRHHRDPRAFRSDPTTSALDDARTRAALVHLRRPSRLSTQSLADTQPFLDPEGRFAFGHNGDFAAHRAARASFRASGRIEGRADSEVGMRWLEDRWASEKAGRLLAGLHGELGGQANLATLALGGSATAYAGNSENPFFAFTLGELACATTGLHSLDRSFFRLVAPGAHQRRLIRAGGAIELQPPA